MGGERYVHCMYANFVFTLVKEGGCGGRGKSECVCVCDMTLHMPKFANFLLHMFIANLCNCF